MAVDEAVLRHGPEPTVRLYGWDPPAISLGRFQSARTDLSALRASGLPIVRRMTGGGAIVHWHELTYSVVLPTDHHLIHLADTRQSYDLLHRPIRSALEAMGIPAADRGGETHGQNGPVLCFDRATPLDLIVNGKKLVGSAQRRAAGRVLQHGSLVIQTNPLQPSTAAISDLLGRSVPVEEIADAVTRAFCDYFPGLAPGDLSAQEMDFAENAMPGYRFS